MSFEGARGDLRTPQYFGECDEGIHGCEQPTSEAAHVHAIKHVRALYANTSSSFQVSPSRKTGASYGVECVIGSQR